jgi:hypothetical protein
MSIEAHESTIFNEPFIMWIYYYMFIILCISGFYTYFAFGLKNLWNLLESENFMFWFCHLIYLKPLWRTSSTRTTYSIGWYASMLPLICDERVHEVINSSSFRCATFRHTRWTVGIIISTLEKWNSMLILSICLYQNWCLIPRKAVIEEGRLMQCWINICGSALFLWSFICGVQKISIFASNNFSSCVPLNWSK